MKIGTGWGAAPQRDLARVALAREAIGAAAELFVDANGGYSRKQAVRIARPLVEAGVTWFEEPVSSDDLAGLAEIRDPGRLRRRRRRVRLRPRVLRAHVRGRRRRRGAGRRVALRGHHRVAADRRPGGGARTGRLRATARRRCTPTPPARCRTSGTSSTSPTTSGSTGCCSTACSIRSSGALRPDRTRPGHGLALDDPTRPTGTGVAIDARRPRYGRRARGDALGRCIAAGASLLDGRRRHGRSKCRVLDRPSAGGDDGSVETSTLPRPRSAARRRLRPLLAAGQRAPPTPAAPRTADLRQVALGYGGGVPHDLAWATAIGELRRYDASSEWTVHVRRGVPGALPRGGGGRRGAAGAARARGDGGGHRAADPAPRGLGPRVPRHPLGAPGVPDDARPRVRRRLRSLGSIHACSG